MSIRPSRLTQQIRRAIDRVRDLYELFEHQYLLILLSRLAYFLLIASEERQTRAQLDQDWNSGARKLMRDIECVSEALCPDGTDTTNYWRLQPIRVYVDRLDRLG